ncbi:MAG: hypothetical protein Q9175_006995 [Cornicularia normoerica]
MLLPNLFNSTPASHHDALRQFQQRLDEGLASGEYKPFVWPYRALGPHLLILYLLLPPTQSKVVYYARYPLFALIIYLSADSILNCRSSMVTVGYGIGLLNAWAVLWSATLIIWNDARGKFKRIEEHDGADGSLPSDQADGATKGVTTGAERLVDGVLKARHVDGEAKDSPGSPHKDTKISDSSRGEIYVWQTLAPTFHHRLDWVCDLVSNFRGVRWNHQISGLPPPPPHIQSSLQDPSIPSADARSHVTRADLIRRDLPNFLLCLIALDVLKTVTLHDPYFWGLPPSTPSPFPYPRLFRISLSLVFVYTSLSTIFLLSPLVFGVILGPNILGQHAWPWLYPSFFGSLSQVYRKGLAGLWGQWWHQLFRYAFEQAGEFAGRTTGWEKKSQKGMLLRIAVAFACSGTLHACASYTTLGDTRPIYGSFGFFMLQPVGIIAQRTASGWMKSRGLRARIPARLRGIANLVVVAVWCYVVGPMVADELAATAIWLYEPLAVSPIRALGGDRIWRWGGRWVRWYSADRWWRSGLAS